MYNDIDTVWLANPFSYLQGCHNVYFTDDMAAVSTPTLLLAYAVCYLWKIVPSVAYKLHQTLYSIQTPFVTKSKYAGRLFPHNHFYLFII